MNFFLHIYSFPMSSFAQLQAVCVCEQKKITTPRGTSFKSLVHGFPTLLPYPELSPMGVNSSLLYWLPLRNYTLCILKKSPF